MRVIHKNKSSQKEKYKSPSAVYQELLTKIEHKKKRTETIENKRKFSISVVDKFYKKLVKVLHPDTVISEEEKKLKHDLMIQLGEAKKTNDVLIIIDLYKLKARYSYEYAWGLDSL